MLLGASRVPRPSAAAGRLARTATLALLLAPSLAVAQQPPADAGTRPRTHTVRRGDTLWDLAQRYLNDAFQWPQIYRLNREVVEDPHWIYPGEVLTLPGVTPATAEAEPEPEPVAPRAMTPSAFAPPVTDAPAPRGQPAAERAPGGLRPGEILAAPWLAGREGLPGTGRVLSSAELPRGDREGSDLRPQVQLHEEVLVSLPAGATGALGERLLVVEEGDVVRADRRDLGRLVYPLGILEVIRTPAAGEATVARVIRLLGMIRPGARVIAYDSTVATAGGAPSIMMGDAGPVTTVRWVWRDQPVPSLQSYVLLEAGERDGVHVGDRFTIFRPRREAEGLNVPDAPAVDVASVQVVRVTPNGSTAIVVGHRLPAIEVGSKARLTARVP